MVKARFVWLPAQSAYRMSSTMSYDMVMCGSDIRILEFKVVSESMVTLFYFFSISSITAEARLSSIFRSDSENSLGSLSTIHSAPML